MPAFDVQLTRPENVVWPSPSPFSERRLIITEMIGVLVGLNYFDTMSASVAGNICAIVSSSPARWASCHFRLAQNFGPTPKTPQLGPSLA
ncbi:hypothetical protein BV898_16214 [Hypsibius exemplaris]|uniref:Uncharacterized protein n=1 Tax=Hypsibius exemplaris TaxID=2072580 RepID=A0A9X6NLJ6_HYPEX|nr:hypothetical protein BV898_16214 [Hypsibius exemplaris]